MKSFGRTVDYLRLSVTDQCNERCVYCRPRRFRGKGRLGQILDDHQLLRIVRVAAESGFRKFRLTGGEPLLRPGLAALIRDMNVLPGVHYLGLTTNGLRLPALARALKAAGLRTVNISLDALSPELYRRMTGGAVQSVLEGIRAALSAGFDRVKINTVLVKGWNEDEIWPLIRFSSELGIPLRLIEQMPFAPRSLLRSSNFLSIGEVIRDLRCRDELIPVADQVLGYGPARYYRLAKAGAVVGFISPMTDDRFCESCNKLRLTADGYLRPCLGCSRELPLQAALADEESDVLLRHQFRLALAKKPRDHGFSDAAMLSRPMIAIGG